MQRPRSFGCRDRVHHSSGDLRWPTPPRRACEDTHSPSSTMAASEIMMMIGFMAWFPIPTANGILSRSPVRCTMAPFPSTADGRIYRGIRATSGQGRRLGCHPDNRQLRQNWTQRRARPRTLRAIRHPAGANASPNANIDPISICSVSARRFIVEKSIVETP